MIKDIIEQLGVGGRMVVIPRIVVPNCAWT